LGTCGASISTWGTFYITISADGYETGSGSFSVGNAESITRAFSLTPTPDPITETPGEEPAQEPELEPETPDEKPEQETNQETRVIQEEIDNAIHQTLTIYAATIGAAGLGTFTLGTIQQEKKR